MIWAYFWLLLLEGVLRKWVVPQLSGPLLIIRDPVMIAILLLAWRAQMLDVGVLIGLGVLGAAFAIVGALQLFGGHANLTVVVYGVRTYLLHIPLPFIMARVWGSEDLRSLSRWTCIGAIAMVPLLVWQFNSPADAWVNAAAGGEGEQIRAAMDRIRVAGVFSYNLGVAFYYAIVCALALASETMPGFLPKRLTRAALAATFLTSTISGSRTNVLSLSIVILAFLGLMIVNPRLASKGFGGLMLASVLLLLPLSMTKTAETGYEVLGSRFDEGTAEEARGSGAFAQRFSFLNRVWDSFEQPFSLAGDTPLIGRGLGLGTNVGSQLSTGDVEFLLSENEWPRVVLEAGPILGFAYMFLRTGFAVWLMVMALKRAAAGNVLPVLLWSACAFNLVLGQWGPPGNLGFAVFAAGMTMVALRIPVIAGPERRGARSRPAGRFTGSTGWAGKARARRITG